MCKCVRDNGKVRECHTCYMRRWYRDGGGRAWTKAWREKNRERLLAEQRERQQANPFPHRAKVKACNGRLWQEVLAAYGPVCACCGETEVGFLTMDHINGGGRAHRRQIGNTPVALHRWLRNHGFPKDNFQILCYNCNGSKARIGHCPHADEPVPLGACG